MQFTVVGNREQPKVLLIHAMFFDGRCFEEISEFLKEDYCVIIPTLDGHGTDDTIFQSVQVEADKIIAYLKQNNITDLELLLGISMGGIIAFEVYRRKQLVTKHVFLDGVPFFRFPKLIRKFTGVVFKQIVHYEKNKAGNNTIIDKKFHKFASHIKEVCSIMKIKSITNLPDACYTYKLPEHIELNGETVAFMYGTKEKARMCIPAVKKYTNTDLILKEGFSHCQFLSDNPKEYSELLCQIVKLESH